MSQVTITEAEKGPKNTKCKIHSWQRSILKPPFFIMKKSVNYPKEVQYKLFYCNLSFTVITPADRVVFQLWHKDCYCIHTNQGKLFN